MTQAGIVVKNIQKKKIIFIKKQKSLKFFIFLPKNRNLLKNYFSCSNLAYSIKKFKQFFTFTQKQKYSKIVLYIYQEKDLCSQKHQSVFIFQNFRIIFSKFNQPFILQENFCIVQDHINTFRFSLPQKDFYIIFGKIQLIFIYRKKI